MDFVVGKEGFDFEKVPFGKLLLFDDTMLLHSYSCFF